ncbi:MscS Mechanosensitive ion channel [Nitrosococcus watsonii C-113]|uniref:Small-conductance mechanosensitive channel n=1 Tax=Nitrosococcus watsoni (strain C-113) TaxID=105559 RepID=D8K7F8_NITWC|nr:MscS Mechanosensitive ion channel [Nitrosococcus watsonii C-113]
MPSRLRKRLVKSIRNRARVRSSASRKGAHLPRREAGVRAYERGARSRLQKFRQGTALAVALTAALLLLFGGIDETAGQEPNNTTVISALDGPAVKQPIKADPEASLEEATTTIRDLLSGFYGLLPKILIALLFLVAAWLLGKALRALTHRLLRGWERSEAIAALARITLFLVAIGAGLSVIAGDARALVGSVGLAGLALSWALQTPIESFTGWVLNALRDYYRPGDRIAVGEVFGDVYRIDILTTTVWEAGGSGKHVAGAQPTGAFITFPNWEILRSNIINYSRDFPYVWDEVVYGLANESDLAYTVEIFRRVAGEVVGPMMRQPIAEYRRLLERERLAFDVEAEPQVYLSLAEAWTNCTIRYLVPVRQRRRWASELILALSIELLRPEHKDRIIGGYPRREIDLLDD